MEFQRIIRAGKVPDCITAQRNGHPDPVQFLLLVVAFGKGKNAKRRRFSKAPPFEKIKRWISERRIILLNQRYSTNSNKAAALLADDEDS